MARNHSRVRRASCSIEPIVFDGSLVIRIVVRLAVSPFQNKKPLAQELRKRSRSAES